MGRFGLLSPLLAVILAVPALAQSQLSVAQLETFIKSSIQLRHPDRQVADFLKDVKLKERLDARTVEDLQGLGAGPRTVEALRNLSAASADLPVAPPPVPAVTVQIPPPSTEEQNAVLDEVRQKALDYTAGLPNFICTQRTQRFVDTRGDGSWRVADVIQEQLSYVDRHEDYKVVLVNNLPVNNVSHQQLGGTTTSGEFGTMLFQIFKPETGAEFHWTRWATLRGRRMHVFEFRVLQRRSEYSVRDEASGRSMIAGYHGLIYADRDTKAVMRIKMDLDGMEDFPINAVALDLNYDLIAISGQDFVLPLRAEVQSRAGQYQSRNEVEFRLYRKFTSDASISFDIPDDLPPEDLQEQPPVPDKR